VKSTSQFSANLLIWRYSRSLRAWLTFTSIALAVTCRVAANAFLDETSTCSCVRLVPVNANEPVSVVVKGITSVDVDGVDDVLCDVLDADADTADELKVDEVTVCSLMSAVVVDWMACVDVEGVAVVLNNVLDDDEDSVDADVSGDVLEDVLDADEGTVVVVEGMVCVDADGIDDVLSDVLDADEDSVDELTIVKLVVGSLMSVVVVDALNDVIIADGDTVDELGKDTVVVLSATAKISIPFASTIAVIKGSIIATVVSPTCARSTTCCPFDVAESCAPGVSSMKR